MKFEVTTVKELDIYIDVDGDGEVGIFISDEDDNEREVAWIEESTLVISEMFLQDVGLNVQIS